ncbi:MAG: hypothetical protein DI535_00165 [Citrobacter freundii]|nr:MAG: hypothetical protein DI535_00165 [Citrobacter freundii]
MNKKDLKLVIQSEMNTFLSREGYKKSKTPADVLSIMEKDTDEYSHSFFSTAYSYDGFKVVYHYGFGINRVVNLLSRIHEQVPLRKGPVVIPKQITGISPGLLKTPEDPFRSFQTIKTEQELGRLLEEIKSFYQHEYTDFFSKYADIKAMDAQFNNLDSFYEKEHGVFPALAFLSVSRLIIARLSDNRQYEEVVNRNFDLVEREWLKDGARYDRTDENMPEVFAAKYLKDVKL